MGYFLFSGNLCFSNVIPEDEGHYVCIAANPVTRSNTEYYANMLIIDSIGMTIMFAITRDFGMYYLTFRLL